MPQPPLQPQPAHLRQAVIVIHGIGEQRPMATLRGFADCVLGADPASATPVYYSKPDTLSESFELRCLRTPGNTRPRTDFFEFYWAHLMPVATWRVIWDWVLLLLRRRPADVPPQFRVLWFLLWLSLIATVIILGFAAVQQLWPGAGATPETSQLKFPTLIVLIGLGLQGLFLAYIGDAATYLSPTPGNVAARHAIRSAAVGLLERVHASGEYSRVVVVGHSLGSVIGYDLLRYAWHRHIDRHGTPASPSGVALKSAEALGVHLRQQTPEAAAAERDKWTVAVGAVHAELRANGHPWLVTDFITMGSPLSHADLLLAGSGDDLRRQIERRELVVAPPVADGKGSFSNPYWYTLPDGSKRTTFVPHHAAWTACVRWTNLYFPSRWLLLGDAVGGPVAPHFGPGVIDIPVHTRQWAGWLSHTFYWSRDAHDAKLPDPPVPALTRALNL